MTGMQDAITILVVIFGFLFIMALGLRSVEKERREAEDKREKGGK